MGDKQTINAIRKWMKGKTVYKDKLRRFLNELEGKTQHPLVGMMHFRHCNKCTYCIEHDKHCFEKYD
jgi:hypothetical protein